MQHSVFSAPSAGAAQPLGEWLRQLADLPGLRTVKHGIRELQTLLNYAGFRQVQHLARTLPLGPLLERQPRFAYKYLSRYTAASFSRPQRLAALLGHYRFLAATVRPEFFRLLHAQPLVWQATHGADAFAITLSYPQRVGFECELSLNFLLNGVLLQVVGFVLVPGRLVGVATGQVLLFSQVQGTRQVELLRHATHTLHDTTPAALLVNAAYGLAEALGITAAAGISAEEQLGIGAGWRFDYNGFWEQFRGERTHQQLYALAVPAPERPLHEIRHNHRARTLRKRQFKKELREAVASHARAKFLQ